MPTDIGYKSKEALPNKLIQPDGTVTDVIGNPVNSTFAAYDTKVALPNKFLNPDGTYSKLNDIIPTSKPYDDVEKVRPYLYELNYNSIDYAYAYTYFKTMQPEKPAGCTSIRKGNLYGRNFDWVFDEGAEFVVKTTRRDDKWASIGVASAVAGLTDAFVQSGVYNEAYKILPFKLEDGINEHGVVANINVVPLDKGTTIGTIPTGTVEAEVCTSMLVRYILDKFTTAQSAVEYLQAHVSIYAPVSLTAMGYDVHFMVADKDKTYLLEFIENELVVTEMTEGCNSTLDGKTYMTNFHLTGVTLNSDGTVYTPETQDDEHNAKITNLITDNGCGLERYNLIANGFEDITDKASMRALLTSLNYTNSYLLETNPRWNTEFTGINNLTVVSTPEEFEPTVESANEIFRNRSRSEDSQYYGTWQTTHSSIYDIATKTLYVVSQEDGIEHSFDFAYYYTAKEVDEIVKTLEKPDLFAVVQELPIVGEHNRIYLVPSTGGMFDEWFYNNNNQWDKLGNIDLSDLATKDEVAQCLVDAEDYTDQQLSQFTPIRSMDDYTSIVKDGTTAQLFNSILNLNLPVGSVLLGTCELTDIDDVAPEMTREEIKVEVYNNDVLHGVMTSTDVEPYEWSIQYFEEEGEWRPSVIPSELLRAMQEAIASAKDYTDETAQTTLSSAETYADTGDATTLQDAKDYTDDTVLEALGGEY